MKASHVKVQVEPSADLPCVTQPPTKGYYCGHSSPMVITRQNHSGIHNCTSCLNAGKPRHTLPLQFSQAPPLMVHAVQKGAVRRPHRFGIRSDSCLWAASGFLLIPPFRRRAPLTSVRQSESHPQGPRTGLRRPLPGPVTGEPIAGGHFR